MGKLLKVNDVSLITEINDKYIIFDEATNKIFYGKEKFEYSFIDLGLSVNWATCNIGAKKLEEIGLYFAWGETEGFKVSSTDDTLTILNANNELELNKTLFYWDDYIHCNGTQTTLNKYCTDSSYGVVDNLTTLELVDDAANILNEKFRIPTYDEIVELTSNTTQHYVVNYNGSGVNGFIFSSKINNNTIFIPFSGVVVNNSIFNVGTYGYIWSSTLYSEYPWDAHCLYFSNSEFGNYYGRYCGLPIRMIKEK